MTLGTQVHVAKETKTKCNVVQNIETSPEEVK